MKDFDTAWREITKRPGVVTVQNREELEHVFNLIQGSESYLEVGTAEGNSLFVLSHAIKGPITYIDYGEKHTFAPREEIINKIDNQIHGILGDSNDLSNYMNVADKRFDVVLIDAGHDAFNVAIDALFYGPLATKYLLFHDVQLPEVSRVFEWYRKQFPQRESYRFVSSETFGYGIIKCQ